MPAKKLKLPEKKAPLQDELKKVHAQLLLMQQQIDLIEKAFSKTAHYSGTANLIAEFGFERYIPTKKDLHKHAR